MYLLLVPELRCFSFNLNDSKYSFYIIDKYYKLTYEIYFGLLPMSQKYAKILQLYLSV